MAEWAKKSMQYGYRAVKEKNMAKVWVTQTDKNEKKYRISKLEAIELFLEGRANILSGLGLKIFLCSDTGQNFRVSVSVDNVD